MTVAAFGLPRSSVARSAGPAGITSRLSNGHSGTVPLIQRR
jgi:hypothetical protein